MNDNGMNDVDFERARRRTMLKASARWLRDVCRDEPFAESQQALRVLQAMYSRGVVTLHPDAEAWLRKQTEQRRYPLVRRWAAFLLEELTR